MEAARFSGITGKTVLRFLVPWILPLLLYAQGDPDLFTKAPPAVEEALRARVVAFYEAQQAGKFRQADLYVAEEAKDAYYGAEKPTCKSWKLERFLWEEGYQKARAFITCDTSLMTITGPLNVKMPLTSHWKLVDGQWFWYLPPQPAVRKTPFGEFRPGPASDNRGGVPLRLPSAQEILSQLRLSKDQVVFVREREGSEEVQFTNGTEGGVRLSLDFRPIPGIEATLDKTDLKAGETARILIKYKPGEAKPPDKAVIAVQVDPFTQSMPIQVSFR